MTIALIGTEQQQQAWDSQPADKEVSIVWLRQPAFVDGAQAYINLQAEAQEWNQSLPDYLPKLVLVNAVFTDGDDWPQHFIRINAWPGFIQGATLEATGGDTALREAAQQVMQRLGRQLEWVSDQAGFVGARIVSAIINEAYLTVQEKVSSKEDIDTAMKLGTNYPWGPFAWANAIGVKNVYALLNKLAREQPRYQPALLLKEEAER